MYPSKGITFVRNDAKPFHFCRSKCHKNFKMKRNPRKLGWTKAFRTAHGKEMVVDSTLAFAARRNAPVRYNRALTQTVLVGMQRVEEVRARRERAFYRQRMAGNRQRQLEADRRLVAENQHLLPPELRAAVPEAPVEKLSARPEKMDVEEERRDEERPQTVRVRAPKVKRKQRLIRGQGPEGMDVDG